MGKRVLLSTLALVLVLGLILPVALRQSPALKWRTDVVWAKATGRLPDIDWMQLLPMLKPGSGFYLESLAETMNPYAAIANPYDTQEDRERGAALYASQCGTCHGDAGEGESAPALATRRYAHGDSDWAIYKVISEGVPGTAMQAHALPTREIWQLIAHLRQLSGREPLSPVATTAIAAINPITAARLAAPEPDNWLTYSGSYSGARYSTLTQVTRENVERLRPLWTHQFETTSDYLEASPLAADGTVYTTTSPGGLYALNASDGQERWSYERTLPSDLSICCGAVNRGVALFGDRVYIGTLDAHLVSLEAATGKVVWDIEVAPHAQGYSITGAPLAVSNTIIVGIAGSEYPIGGFIDAYDAASGARVWRFRTIPQQGEPGNDTWSGDSWKNGGGGAWMTGSYDPDLDLIYWGIGNPNPDFYGAGRLGDNLYTDSVVALDPGTGALRWYFQFTPHDEHDWDANHVPVLLDKEVDGKLRKLLTMATKNGFLYVLDRRTGEYLGAVALVKQTWAASFDAKGRPVRNPATMPSEKGTLVYPGPGGGANWWPGAYSPNDGLLFVPVLEQGKIFFNREPEVKAGQMILGSTTSFLFEDLPITWLKAVDPATQEIRWAVRGPERTGWGRAGGALATAGGLVFWGDHTIVFALDSATGAVLWKFQTGGKILSAATSFAVNGEQRIAIMAGRVLYVFGLD